MLTGMIPNSEKMFVQFVKIIVRRLIAMHDSSMNVLL